MLTLLLTKNADMSVFEAFGMSILGFALVFVVLVVLMMVIYLQYKIISLFSGKKAPETVIPQAVAAPAAASPVASAPLAAPAQFVEAPGSSGEITLYNIDDKTAAILMAIVADELKTPLNQLKFKSIKEI